MLVTIAAKINRMQVLVDLGFFSPHNIAADDWIAVVLIRVINDSFKEKQKLFPAENTT